MMRGRSGTQKPTNASVVTAMRAAPKERWVRNTGHVCLSALGVKLIGERYRLGGHLSALSHPNASKSHEHRLGPTHLAGPLKIVCHTTAVLPAMRARAMCRHCRQHLATHTDTQAYAHWGLAFGNRLLIVVPLSCSCRPHATQQLTCHPHADRAPLRCRSHAAGNTGRNEPKGNPEKARYTQHRHGKVNKKQPLNCSHSARRRIGRSKRMLEIRYRVEAGNLCLERQGSKVQPDGARGAQRAQRIMVGVRRGYRAARRLKREPRR